MDWFPYPVETTTGPEWLRIDPALRGHHVALLSFCAQRENGGVIAGAGTWTNRDWDRVAGMSLRTIKGLVEARLATWRGVDLEISLYDSEAEVRAAARSAQRTKAAKTRWKYDAARIAGRNASVEQVQCGPQCTLDHIRSEKTPPPPPSSETDPEKTAQEKSREARRVADGVIAKLNRDASRAWTLSEPTLKLIRGLLARGYTETDMRRVVWHRCQVWGGDPKMQEYLRPSTLFRPTKFPEYLDSAKLARGEVEPPLRGRVPPDRPQEGTECSKRAEKDGGMGRGATAGPKPVAEALGSLFAPKREG